MSNLLAYSFSERIQNQVVRLSSTHTHYPAPKQLKPYLDNNSAHVLEACRAIAVSNYF